jgi:methyl-accepting chemotaxis protein
VKSINLNDMKIGIKYGLALGVSIFLFVLSTIIVSGLLSNVDKNISTMGKTGQKAIDLTEMSTQFRIKDAKIADYIILKDEDIIGDYQAESEKFDELTKKLEAGITSEELRKLYNDIVANDKMANQIFLDEIVPAVKANDELLVNSLRKKTTLLSDSTDNLLDKMRTVVNEERNTAVKAASGSSSSAFWVLILSIAISTLLGGAAVYFVNKMVVTNLNQVVLISKQVAKGNLAVRKIAYHGKDEIGQLSSAINEMTMSLRKIVRQIVTVSQDVNSHSEELTQMSNEVKEGSVQIAATMQQLTVGSEQQAKTASDIALLTDDLNKKVFDVNKDGESLKNASGIVLEISNNGKKQMQQSVDQMNTINELVLSSVNKVRGLDERTGDITSLVQVIEEIAERTNLLALNASIEAARAGESGKGFGVVASEVRKLAEQSANSVNEISEIITNIQKESKETVKVLQGGYKQVEEGSKVISSTHETFDNINDAVTVMADRIQNVANRIVEIANSSDKISSSIESIASVAEEAAAGVEQSSAAAQQQSSSMDEIYRGADSLAHMAEELNAIVERFKA